MNDETFPDHDPGIWYELSKDALATQLSFVDAVDAKVAGFLGTGSALVGILVAVYALRPGIAAATWPTRALLATLAAYGVVAIVSFITLAGRRWDTGPDIRKLEAETTEKKYTDHQVRWRAASGYLHASESNDTRYGLKRWGLRIALVAMIIETFSVASGLWSLRP